MTPIKTEEVTMLNGNSGYGVTNATGGSCANDLGGGLVVPTPVWFMPVMVWHPRPGK